MDPIRKLFFGDVRKQNWPETGKVFTVCSDLRSQSIKRGRISREGVLDHRESREWHDKIFAAKTVKRQNFQKKMDQENSFQWGIFIFLAAGKLTFLGGV